jgi:hypothetical protein
MWSRGRDIENTAPTGLGRSRTRVVRRTSGADHSTRTERCGRRCGCRCCGGRAAGETWLWIELPSAPPSRGSRDTLWRWQGSRLRGEETAFIPRRASPASRPESGDARHRASEAGSTRLGPGQNDRTSRSALSRRRSTADRQTPRRPKREGGDGRCEPYGDEHRGSSRRTHTVVTPLPARARPAASSRPRLLRPLQAR